MTTWNYLPRVSHSFGIIAGSRPNIVLENQKKNYKWIADCQRMAILIQVAKKDENLSIPITNKAFGKAIRPTRGPIKGPGFFCCRAKPRPRNKAIWLVFAAAAQRWAQPVAANQCYMRLHCKYLPPIYRH